MFALIFDSIKNLIPIAFDNACSNNKCSGHYVSLNTRSSFDVFSSLLKKSVDLFPSFEEKENNVLGIAKNNVIPFNLESNQIKGILCSTNNNNYMNNGDWIPVECTNSVRYNNNFLSIKASFKAKCPKNCLDFKENDLNTNIY